MSEILANDGNYEGSSYRYNHGINGWSWLSYWGNWGNAIAPTKYDPYPDATGRNQFFGDGAVKWRAISPEYDDNLPNTMDYGFQEDRWNGPGSGWVNPYDTSYY